MRNHYSNYFRGIPNFKETRTKLVTLYKLNELLEVLDMVEQTADQWENALRENS